MRTEGVFVQASKPRYVCKCVYLLYYIFILVGTWVCMLPPLNWVNTLGRCGKPRELKIKKLVPNDLTNMLISVKYWDKMFDILFD